MKKRKLKLRAHEYVITAYAQPACGPGWANMPIVVLIGDGASGKISTEYIQPGDQNEEMTLLYAFSALACDRMTSAIRKYLSK